MFNKFLSIIIALQLIVAPLQATTDVANVFAEERNQDSNSILITNGYEAEIKDFPYQAAIHLFNMHHCGAVIIRDNAVLTAAHCILALHESILSVKVGTTYKNSGGIRVGIKTRIVHPDFNVSPGDFDIAIAILEQKLNFSEFIQPIELQRFPTICGERATVSGWGRTEINLYATEHLRAADIRISNQKQCFSSYEGAGYTMTDRMLCAGIENSGRDACQGDSGGPLICRFGRRLCGIVSFGKGCAKKGYPGVYTNISNVRKWILESLQ